VTSTVKSSLDAINEISRQLLSQFDSYKESIEGDENPQELVEEHSIAEEQLASLTEKRQCLITELFNEYTQEQISIELQIVNEMVSLDKQLTMKAQSNKQSLAEKMLKLRKHKKVTKIYQKY
jgi:FixJ family two-component response regulator